MELNKIYCMDNLKLLKQLNDNCIDLIYCDILYGTGRNFGDYKDIKANKYDVFIFYEERFKEMYRVLKNTGILYIQCDQNINHWIRILLDDIFGYDNFQREIVWCYTSGGISKTDFPKKHDYIIKYTKSKKYTYNPILKPYSEKTLNRGLTKCKNNYKLNNNGTPIVDWWNDITPLLSPTCYERVGYATQKPKELLDRIIKTSSNPNDIVADFFCGSGTSMVVAKELGRRYIGCDINQKAVEITNRRLYE